MFQQIISSPDFGDLYRRALQRHLDLGDEASLLDAYELGREALARNLSILDMLGFHHDATHGLIKEYAKDGMSELIDKTDVFLDEALSPYEVARLGSQESNRALRRMFELLEQEAKRIAYALHDESAQMLATVYLELAEISKMSSDAVAQRVSQVSKHLDEVREQLRRLSHELRPLILDQLGLPAGLRFLAQGIEKRTGLSVAVTGELALRLDTDVETALYRSVQEALNNVYKHARATRADVHVWLDDGVVNCTITDDGDGIADDLSTSHGLGLVSIRERVAALGGTLKISSAVGEGVRLWVSIPV